MLFRSNKKAAGFLSALSCPIIYYLVRKDIGSRKGADFIRDLLRLVSVVEVNRAVLEKGLALETHDFEDGIQIACAESCHADYMITRDPSGYKKISIPVLSPAEYLATF